MQLSENALTTLEKRYFLRDNEGDITEDAQGLLKRVSIAVAGAEETPLLRQAWTHIFMQMIGNLDFLPNTPTLMNAGKQDGQLSACFVLPIEDSMDGIFKTLHDTAIIHKTGGGTGFAFSSLRPEGSMVSNKSGVSTGPLSFCQIYDCATDKIKQGASRRGANMMTFDVHHPDILQFIDMKLTPGTMTNFNVSVTVTDEFMQAVKDDTDYELRHPYTGVTSTLPARYVWSRIAKNAWQAAEPGLIFIDRVNQFSPYEELIVATNPCGEQPLPPYGSCNLGSINLSNFVSPDGLDYGRLRDTVVNATRFLDNVVTVNKYPTPELQEHADKYRNIGLGVMGWADALIKLKLPYTSPAATELGRHVQEFINKVSHEYSVALGEEKGVPSGAPFKTFYDYSSPLRRNATLTTVAPTGTLSLIANCSSGIEPNFAFEYEKHVLETVLVEYHPLYKAAASNGGVDKTVFIDAHQVDVYTHVDMQAAFQEHCDSAISKTINLPKEATIQDVEDAYLRAYETGCKGITVYRDGSREGVLHRKDEPKTTIEGYCPECGTELIPQEGCDLCPQCSYSHCSIA